MAKIQCPKDYNYWYILSYVGIDPAKDTELYGYDSVNEVLQVDVVQEVLDDALSKYDHKTWLKELEEINNPLTEEQQRLLDLEIAMAAILGGGI